MHRITAAVTDLRAEHPNAPIPVDLATTSASGLDPHITPATVPQPLERGFQWGDIVVLLGVVVLIYAGGSLAVHTPLALRGPDISLAPEVLPYYAVLSVGRMAAEIFTVGERDFRLPGLGAYLQEAANRGDISAIAWGIGALVTINRLVWRRLYRVAEERYRLE